MEDAIFVTCSGSALSAELSETATVIAAAAVTAAVAAAAALTTASLNLSAVKTATAVSKKAEKKTVKPSFLICAEAVRRRIAAILPSCPARFPRTTGKTR